MCKVCMRMLQETPIVDTQLPLWLKHSNWQRTLLIRSDLWKMSWGWCGDAEEDGDFVKDGDGDGDGLVILSAIHLLLE